MILSIAPAIASILVAISAHNKADTNRENIASVAKVAATDARINNITPKTPEVVPENEVRKVEKISENPGETAK